MLAAAVARARARFGVDWSRGASLYHTHHARPCCCRRVCSPPSYTPPPPPFPPPQPQFATPNRDTTRAAILQAIGAAKEFVYISVMDYLPVTLYEKTNFYSGEVDEVGGDVRACARVCVCVCKPATEARVVSRGVCDGSDAVGIIMV